MVSILLRIIFPIYLLNTSDVIIIGNTTYIEDYSNATTNETEGLIHLINTSDLDFNDTIATLEDCNASGFILMHNNTANISSIPLNISGVAVSEKNGSLLKNLTQNGTVIVIPPLDGSPPKYGILKIHHSNDTPTRGLRKIWIINASWWEHNWKEFEKIYYSLSTFLFAKAFLICDPYHNRSHFHYLYAGGQVSPFLSFYSKRPVPMFSINGSVIYNAEMTDVWDWVQNFPIEMYFSVAQRNNKEAISYNIYCDLEGKDSTKTVVMSGGHYEGWWGQMTSDNAVGTAQMLGILKYMNDNEITPRHDTRFIFHGGHENTARGSQSHVNNDSNSNFLEKAFFFNQS